MRAMRRGDNPRKGRGGKRFDDKNRSSHRPPSENRAQESSAFDGAKGQSRLREARQLLAGIGTPPPQPFKPDRFQLEALAALEFEDVLVTAPTGSGKTWIAREEIRRLLAARSEEHTSELQSLRHL